MQSISGSKYREECGNFLRKAFLHPRMYFRTLVELEATMYGHIVAFWSLGLSVREDSFNYCFGHWLHEKKIISFPASGWAYEIPQVAKMKGVSEDDFLKKFLDKFLDDWCKEPEGAKKVKKAGTHARSKCNTTKLKKARKPA